MGGNALKNEGAVRVERQFAEDLGARIVACLAEHGVKAAVIKAYSQKKTYGDLDIVFTSPLSREGIVLILKDNLDIRGEYDNGPVFGFGAVIDENSVLQVDMIRVKDIEFDYALNYFNWNDLGNFIGRIAHKFGMKHGHDGLWYIVRGKNRVIGEILLTLDHATAVHVLGFAPTPDEGFDTPESIFDYVRAGVFYNPHIFLLDNRNHIARMRDRKRAMYTALLEYIKRDMTPERTRVFYEYEDNKDFYLPTIFDAFPHARIEYDAIMKADRERVAYAEKVNGDIVMQLTYLKGKELGEFMYYLRGLPAFADKQAIINTEGEVVKHMICIEFVKYKVDKIRKQ